VPVNNADITHDATLHRMKAEQWTGGIAGQKNLLVP
jgi:hypothetical protein